MKRYIKLITTKIIAAITAGAININPIISFLVILFTFQMLKNVAVRCEAPHSRDIKLIKLLKMIFLPTAPSASKYFDSFRKITNALD